MCAVRPNWFRRLTFFSGRPKPVLAEEVTVKHLCSLLALAIALTLASTAQAKAPPGRFVVDAKGETVHDTWTQRTWQRVVVAGTYKSADAKTYCSELTLTGGGWHLPTMRELQSIVDRQQVNPAIDPVAFPSTPAVQFWSSTKHFSNFNIWNINFYYGTSDQHGTQDSFRVRCVR